MRIGPVGEFGPDIEVKGAFVLRSLNESDQVLPSRNTQDCKLSYSLKSKFNECLLSWEVTCLLFIYFFFQMYVTQLRDTHSFLPHSRRGHVTLFPQRDTKFVCVYYLGTLLRDIFGPDVTLTSVSDKL